MKQIAVMFGGCSPEYSVSLASAAGVLRNLDRARFAPVMIGITRQGDWYWYQGPVDNIEQDTWFCEEWCTPAALSQSRTNPGLWVWETSGVRKLTIDAALPILHGENGEDGSVQGALSLAGIPLAGCGILASALCMDKARAHQLVQQIGIRVPKQVVLYPGEGLAKAESFLEDVGCPAFVKPVKAGSSYGITRLQTKEDLAQAVKLAFQYDDTVIVEEGIPGFEVGCAVLGTKELTVGAVDEIELVKGFFDYTEKYTLETAAIHLPARISAEKTKEVQETAKKIYRVLGCTGFARVDMFLTPSGELVFNEVNTIPGFTEHSRYPGMMRAAGLSLQEVLTRILETAKPSADI